ncbi:MAG: N-acetyltransferase [Firmicutes bacterium]|nr:N-acetyltransferase [Bacillota bacterium]
MNYIYEKNRIYVQDEFGTMVAEVTFPKIDEQTVNINHTYVDARLRGMGIANKLLEEAVKEIENQNLTCIATCSYAIHWFEKHPEKKNRLK